MELGAVARIDSTEILGGGYLLREIALGHATQDTENVFLPCLLMTLYI